jgi:hypothetical protein
VTTQSSVDQIKQSLEGTFRGAELHPIQSSMLDSGPQAAVELLAEKKGIGGLWAVQVYVFDNGDQRQVKLVALGDRGLSRAWGGMRNTASLAKSLKIAERAAAAINA